MTNPERKELLADFMDVVKTELLSRADRLPETWDDHEIYLWVHEQFKHELSSIMTIGSTFADRQRIAACLNDIVVYNL
jgi:hypothetical protein